MSYSDTVVQLNDYRRQIADIRAEMRALQASISPQLVPDYVFDTLHGPVALADLFGDKSDLFVIHNMGKGCSYCTLWADGFNGVSQHLEDRAAFVVSSPDAPETQQEFANSRGWRFRMVSHANTSFAEDMGYRRDGKWFPGVSVFRKQGADIVRVSDAQLGPNDDFCVVWSFLELLPAGPDGWRPRYSY